MTTNIKIAVGGGNRAVEVEVIDDTSAGPTTSRTITLKPGETSEDIGIHGTRRVSVREVGDFIELLQPAPASAAGAATLGRPGDPPAKPAVQAVEKARS